MIFAYRLSSFFGESGIASANPAGIFFHKRGWCQAIHRFYPEPGIAVAEPHGTCCHGYGTEAVNAFQQ